MINVVNYLLIREIENILPYAKSIGGRVLDQVPAGKLLQLAISHLRQPHHIIEAAKQLFHTPAMLNSALVERKQIAADLRENGEIHRSLFVNCRDAILHYHLARGVVCGVDFKQFTGAVRQSGLNRMVLTGCSGGRIYG